MAPSYYPTVQRGFPAHAGLRGMAGKARAGDAGLEELRIDVPSGNIYTGNNVRLCRISPISIPQC